MPTEDIIKVFAQFEIVTMFFFSHFIFVFFVAWYIADKQTALLC